MHVENNLVLLVATLFLTYVHIALGLLEPEMEDAYLRHRRSVVTDAGYGSRLQAGSNVAKSSNVLRSIYGKFGPGKRSFYLPSEEMKDNRLIDLGRNKRMLSDYGYGSRLQAGRNVAYSNDRGSIFGSSGPGKRSLEMTDFDVLNDNDMKYKRFTSDYGYGSRLQAGENIANSWGRNQLFGTMGPGKRSYSDFSERELAKRIAIDLGYGSRAQAAENAAKSSSNEELFGIYGPGKRSTYVIPPSDILDYYS